MNLAVVVSLIQQPTVTVAPSFISAQKASLAFGKYAE